MAGQIVLPDGYLEQVYDAVRGAGGVCIADEVQTDTAASARTSGRLRNTALFPTSSCSANRSATDIRSAL